jgi:hypothetical protein
MAAPDSEHLQWLIESRAANQRSSLRLLKLLREYPKEVKAHANCIAAQRLVSVSFSLWRAAFLTDRNEDDDGLAHAKDFLERLVVDNAINYPQDRSARDWSWGYYMTNAYLQLHEIQTDWQIVLLEPPIPPTGLRPRWDYLQEGLSKAISKFELDLAGKK